MHPYTVCLTSCARFDLLKRTLETLLPRLEGPCKRIIIGEDSGDRGVFDVVERFQSPMYPPIHILLNPRRLDICRNIDRIYAEVDTDWIFHCEDDWEFFRTGFIHESFAVMQDGEISTVSLRDMSGFPLDWLPVEDSHYVVNVDGPNQRPGLNFNPGLRRMCDYRAIGPYGRIAPNSREKHVSMAYLSAGKRMAALQEPAVRHIGEGRHIGKPRALTYRISRMIERLLH